LSVKPITTREGMKATLSVRRCSPRMPDPIPATAPPLSRQ
jgi:hypothetical protein